jgi:hypothetical protein
VASGSWLLTARPEATSETAEQRRMPPLGFANDAEFDRFGAVLAAGLPPGCQPVLQGSAVTGGNWETGERFDEGRQSDLDIALAGDELFDKARAMGLRVKDGTRIGPLSDQVLAGLGLLELRDRLANQCGREVRFMLFVSIKAALKRPSIWIG